VTLPISITQNRESTKWSWLNPGKPFQKSLISSSSV
jgi:hypothetical protein